MPWICGEGVETTDRNFHNVPSERTLLSFILGLVRVDEQAAAVRLIRFMPSKVSCKVFIIPHSIMAKIALPYSNLRLISRVSTTPDTTLSIASFIYSSSHIRGYHTRGRGSNTRYKTPYIATSSMRCKPHIGYSPPI